MIHDISDLTKEEKQLLKEVSKDPSGIIKKTSPFGSDRIIETNKKRFGGEQHRNTIKWEHALNKLIDRGCVVPMDYQGLFEISYKGYQLADALPEDG